VPICDIPTIIDWLRPHTAINLDAKAGSTYVRVRAGRVQKSAIVVWRKAIVGENPSELATEIMTRFAGISGRDRAWLEVMEEAGKVVADTLPLGSPPENHDESAGMGEIDPESGAMGVIGAVVGALVTTNGQLATRLDASLDRNQSIMLAHVDSSARATAAETLLSWIEKNGLPGSDNGDMGRALEMLAPTLEKLAPGVAAGMSAWANGTRKTKATGEPETPDQHADRLLTEVEQLWVEHPGSILRPAILIRLNGLGVAVSDRLKGNIGEPIR